MQDVIDCINCAKKSTTADEGQRLDLIYLPREAMEQKKKTEKKKKMQNAKTNTMNFKAQAAVYD